MKLKINENQVKVILDEILKENAVSNIKSSFKEIILGVAHLLNFNLSGINKHTAINALENDEIIIKISKILSDRRIEVLTQKMESFGISNALNRILNNREHIEYFINERLKEMGKKENFKIFIENM